MAKRCAGDPPLPTPSHSAAKKQRISSSKAGTPAAPEGHSAPLQQGSHLLAQPAELVIEEGLATVGGEGAESLLAVLPAVAPAAAAGAAAAGSALGENVQDPSPDVRLAGIMKLAELAAVQALIPDNTSCSTVLACMEFRTRVSGWTGAKAGL